MVFEQIFEIFASIIKSDIFSSFLTFAFFPCLIFCLISCFRRFIGLDSFSLSDFIYKSFDKFKAWLFKYRNQDESTKS